VTEGPAQNRPSDKDEVKPFHAREVATGKEAADVVAAVIKHAAEKDQAAKQKAPPKPQPLWMLPVGIMLSVLAGFLLVAPPAFVVVNPIAAQTPEVQVENLESLMWVQMNKIELYRMSTQQLPPTLAAAGGSDAFEYTVVGQNYTLCGAAAEEDVCFISAVETPQAWAARELANLSSRIGD
jgi:hypothetical protein